MRKAMWRGVMAGIVSLFVFDALATRAGIASTLIPRASSEWPWTASRAAAVSAYVALTLEIVFGLFLSSGAADRWIARARSVDVHRWLSSVSLTLIGMHAFVLVGDRYIRFDVLDVAVPFLAPYRRVAVALGILAAYLAAIVHISFALRNRISARAWRVLHYASFGVFAFATAHGMLAGTDANLPWMRAMYGTACVAVGGLTIARVWIAAVPVREFARRPNSTPPTTTPAPTGAASRAGQPATP